MKNKKTILYLFIISFFLTINLSASGNNSNNYKVEKNSNHKNFAGISSKNWPKLLSDAVIENYPKLAEYDMNRISWNYELGVVLNSIWKVWLKTKDPKYFNYVKKNIDYFISNEGNIKTYVFKKFRLDDIAPGRVVLDLYKATHENKYKIAADILRKQLSEQPRTKEGGFWHKEIYPHQMWLDGLYMAEPFYAEYAKMFNEPKDYDDIAMQFILMYKHTVDPKTGYCTTAGMKVKLKSGLILKRVIHQVFGEDPSAGT